MTYAELDERARAIAVELQRLDLLGERAMLLYPPGLEYVAAFFGCLYAGVIAVPAFPPHTKKPSKRLEAIALDAESKVVLTSNQIHADMSTRLSMNPALENMHWISTEAVDNSKADQWQEPTLSPDTLSFLQYTSGSTSLPKGVMVSHQNLLSNFELITQTMGLTPESRGVTWLPPYHDMGLIGGLLIPMFVGYHVTMMAPIDFLKSPYLWLKKMTETRATATGGPNFAYEMCVEKITPEQMETLDLSSWQLAFNGAEPIRLETLEKFADKFAACGFRKEAYFPCYGLAEATLLVTGKSQEAPTVTVFDAEQLKENIAVEMTDRADANARTLVSSGKLVRADQTLLIVDPNTREPLTDGQIGEIWLAGKSIASGYWNRPEQNEETFGARLCDTNEGPFLRTGDLGFLKDGELYVTGRRKDLIIIRGRNYYPQDIELTIESSHPAVRPGCGGAFSVEVDGEEQLVAVFEIERTLRKNANVEEIASVVRQAVLEEHGLVMHDFVLIKTATIPKTSSGKIQRHQCRQLYLDNALDTIGSSKFEGAADGADFAILEEDAITRDQLLAMPREERQQPMLRHLKQLISRAIGVDMMKFEASHPLDALGVASLVAVELSNRIETEFGVPVPMETFLQEITIGELAAKIVATMSDEGAWAEFAQVPAAEPDEVPELSHGQKALWFLHKLEPGNPAYNLPFAARINSALDVEAARRAFQKLVDRHEVLRTTFAERDGKFVEIVHPFMSVFFEHVNGGTWSEQERNAQLNQWAALPFHLEDGPLLRVHLLTVSEAEHILLLNLHHSVSDFWSQVVLIDEFGSLYQAELTGAQAELPALELQFADFVRWQNKLIAGPRGEELLSYWQQRLTGVSVLNLPTDRPRPAVQTYNGGAHAFQLSADLTRRLKGLAKEQGTTLYVTLLAAFQTLLHRYTGQEDIAVGSPVVNRRLAKFEGVHGYFTNPVVMRTDFSENKPFADLLQDVRKLALEALQHQDYPFALLVEKIQAERNLSHSPLFQTMFMLQSSQRDENYARFSLGEAGGRMEVGGLAFESVALDTRFAQFDLTLSMAEENGELFGSLNYNSDLFDVATIARMAGHLEALLSGAAANPQAKVAEIMLLTEAEQRLMLHDWNDTRTEQVDDTPIHVLFERQAAQTPDRVAVVFEDESLTYRELNERANRLAHHLQKQGVGPEVLVGICMERSLEMMIGLIGIHKAGGAYVPLDPTYPAERLVFILEDAKVPVLLTQQRLRGRLPKLDGVQVIDLDHAWSAIAEESAENTDSGACGEQLAYVIYTSGSTGKPKGVLVEHRNVANFFTGMDQRIGATEEDALLAVTSICFDISVLELFWTLTRGVKVILLSEREAAGGVDRSGGGMAGNGMEFSLFYFANDAGGQEEDKYRLLIEGAKFADRNGFSAVWTPERHFHAFGGLYPSPSVMASALSMVTENVQLRAGSVVLPLHHPVRVAEEWSVVDNLSKGRVGLSIASGWHSDDFIFAPQNYKDRSNVMFENIVTLQKLWRGESVNFTGGAGNEVSVKTLPRPIQSELPIWVTTGGNPETFRRAGAIGANILTHLLGQSVEELAEKIAIYRQARADHGHDPQAGHVSLMLHAFIGDSMEQVREIVRGPFTEYLRTSVGLIENLVKSLNMDVKLDEMSEENMNGLLAMAFERYFETSGLFGTPESCYEMTSNLKNIGVNEVACLIDFGIEGETVLNGLGQLAALRERCAQAETEAKEGYSIAEQAQRHGATLMQCTPSLMRIMSADRANLEALRPLRSLLLGGEALPGTLAEELRRDLPATRVVNMYGPTEATVWATTQEVEEILAITPIGKPFANMQTYILDPQLQPVPVGVPGELFIGGAGVTRGYWQRPDLTEERFLPSPFAGERSERLYRTGDLAAYAADGTIRFLGRIDHQVKLRGFRIELGEIEEVLAQLESVREAVVVAREEAGGTYLAAYIVPAGANELNTQEVRAHLAAKLPDYMVPAVFLALKEMPLTPNGKIDRKALPDPQKLRAKSEAHYVAPTTETEHVVTEIWKELLKLDKVGVQDNFFELGGHSILIVQLHAKLKEQMGVDIPIIQLFKYPTVASLAKFLSEGREEEGKVVQQSKERAENRKDLMRQRRQSRTSRTTNRK